MGSVFNLIFPKRESASRTGLKLTKEHAIANEYAEKAKEDMTKAIALSNSVHFNKPDTIKEFISYIKKSSLELNLSKIYYVDTVKKRALDYELEISMLNAFVSMIDRLNTEYTEEIIILDPELKGFINKLSLDIVQQISDDLKTVEDKLHTNKNENLLHLKYTLLSLREFFFDLSNFKYINYYSISLILEYLARENFYSNKMRTNYLNFTFHYHNASVHGQGRVQIELGDAKIDNKIDINLRNYTSLHYDNMFYGRQHISDQLFLIKTKLDEFIKLLVANNSDKTSYSYTETSSLTGVIKIYLPNMPDLVKFSSYAQSRRSAVKKYLALLHESIVENKYIEADILKIK